MASRRFCKWSVSVCGVLSALVLVLVGELVTRPLACSRPHVFHRALFMKCSSQPSYVPDYNRCVAISTNASLKCMLRPGALVLLTPLVIGFVFGVHALAGTLVGSLVSAVQLAISASNSGGAWDNAKKFIGGAGGCCACTRSSDVSALTSPR